MSRHSLSSRMAVVKRLLLLPPRLKSMRVTRMMKIAMMRLVTRKTTKIWRNLKMKTRVMTK